MTDEAYLRRRAGEEAQRAAIAGSPGARSVHEELARSYRQRADAAGGKGPVG